MADVDVVVATIRNSPRVKEALRRWITEGRTVEMSKPIENETLPSGNPRKNPDFLVDGVPTEVKSRTEPMAGTDWIKTRIRDGSKQIKRSDPDPTKVKPGDVELQLYGPDTRMPLEEMERQVRSELTAVQHRSVKRVAIYHDNVLIGEWIRVGSATVRRFP